MKLMAAGDQVLVAEFGDRIDEAVNDQVHALAAKIEEQQIPGIGEVVPTFRSLLIYYDSYQLSYREAAGKIEELARRRSEKQPLEYPSAGSMFKRPTGHFAAALIDQCGLKGVCVGGAQVSEKHAGFVVNRGGATCADVLELVERVKARVLAETGVALEMEVKVLR